jgi:hypothetical protein
MKGFRILPDDEGHGNPNVIILKDERNGGGGLEAVLSQWAGEELRKKLGKEEKKSDDKPKTKTFTKSEVTCWSLMLLFTAPWTGLWVLNALDKVKADWLLMLAK